jgi:opacity protein-like surface antigen
MIRFASAFLILISSAAFAQSSAAPSTPDQTPSSQNPTNQATSNPAPDQSQSAQPAPEQNPPPAPAQTAAQGPPQATLAAPASHPPVPPTPQPVPKVQVFGGYSLLHTGVGNMNGTNIDLDLNIYPLTLVPQTNFNGWNAEGQYNINRWLGAVADFSGYSGKPFTGMQGVSGVPNETSYSILAGPVLTYRGPRTERARLTPYVHALFGWNRSTLAASTLTDVPFPVSSSKTSYTDFVMTFGGGLDFRATKHFSIRLGQLDWFRTSIDLNSFYGSAFNTTVIQGFEVKEKNVRVAGGIVIGF